MNKRVIDISSLYKIYLVFLFLCVESSDLSDLKNKAVFHKTLRIKCMRSNLI